MLCGRAGLAAERPQVLRIDLTSMMDAIYSGQALARKWAA
jgi:hypothetical protein